jgi:hypothetical protein
VWAPAVAAETLAENGNGTARAAVSVFQLVGRIAAACGTVADSSAEAFRGTLALIQPNSCNQCDLAGYDSRRISSLVGGPDVAQESSGFDVARRAHLRLRWPAHLSAALAANGSMRLPATDGHACWATLVRHRVCMHELIKTLDAKTMAMSCRYALHPS